ncbi:MAG: HAD family phosphatase [Lachnospiraceae bacterium]|nr:HAD family phosphatase [Lachnospiraceae bacterium]MBR0091305.1 HAD family phosphatase [Lachnospiraceae bacterium]
MIKNIIFDMGSVLIRFDRNLFIERTGITDPADKELLMREVFLSLEWARMDRGSLTDEEAFQIMCKRLPERLHDAAHKLVAFWDRPILEIEGMYELIEELKGKGYGIYLLSNASYRQHEYWPRIPASKFFDDKLVSCDVHLVKPQPEIYRLMLEKFSLQAEECFFIDDVPMNIEGAFFCGIAGAVFHDDVQELRRKMREAGVDVECN